MYRSIHDLTDRIAVSVTECPTPMIAKAVIDAGREFCRNTRCHVAPGRVQGREDRTQYELLPAEPFTDVIDIKNPSHPGRTVGNILTLHRPTTDLITADLVLIPRMDTKKIWEGLTDVYADAIVAGALSRLYRQRGAAYFSPELAQQESMRFADHLHNARASIQQPRTIRNRGGQWL